MQELKLFRQIGFALDGALMLGFPVVGLQPQFDELPTETAAERPEQEKEDSEFAKALPEPGEDVGFGIEISDQDRGDRDESSVFRRKYNQGIGDIGVHALQW